MKKLIPMLLALILSGCKCKCETELDTPQNTGFESNHTLNELLHEQEQLKRYKIDKTLFYDNCSERCLKLISDTSSNNVQHHIFTKHKSKFKLKL